MAVLVAILYYASTVDGRAPSVLKVLLTQHLSGDPQAALTTSSIEVDFSEPVEQASAESAFAISPALDGSFSWSSASLTFTPAARLPLRTEFVVTLAPGVRDRVGNVMASAGPTFKFTTVGNPSVLGSEPMEAATDVALDAPIVIDFSTLMDTTSVEHALELVPATEVRLRWAREKLTIAPLAPLEPNVRYTLRIGIGALDQAGTPLDRVFKIAFRTVPSSLGAETTVPADRVAGVAVTTPIAIVFDRALDPASVRDDLLTITPAVAGSLDAIAPPGAAGLLDGGLRVLRFQPSGPLDPNTTYEVTLGPGLLGVDGSGLPAGLSWSFTTGAPTATLSNQIVFISDRAGIANLWAMNPDGSNQRQLSAELSPVIDYAIARDGRAFLVGDGAAIVWQTADGSARRPLTETNAVEFDPAYSPDGTTITFGRADPRLGTSLGIWMRDADGSDPRPIELPAAAAASPSPAIPRRVPLLRAPRISPDGTAVAFVDQAGRVAILELGSQQLSAAPFVALSVPTWLPDSSGVLVSGLSGGSGIGQIAYRPGSPVTLLDPVSLPLDAAQVAGLQVVRMDRGASSVTQTGLESGAARPTLDADQRLAYIELGADDSKAGKLWVSKGIHQPGDPVTGDSAAPVGSASFTPEPQTMVISGIPAPGDAAAIGGVWLVDLRNGVARQLSLDGWLPHWLP